MKTLKQLISHILIFQFCFACTGSGGSSGVNSPSSQDDETTINLQGTLARVINNVGDIFISRAAAQDGTIEVTDFSDPTNPISIGTFDVEDESQGFSIDIPSNKIKGKVISLEYQGGEKTAIGSRSLVIQIEEDKSSVTVEEMNEDSTLQSNIIKARLQDESPESIDELKKRFRELHEQKSKILEQIKDLGIKASEFNEYVKKGDQSVIGAIAYAWASAVDGQEEQRQEGLRKFRELTGDLLNSISLNCEDNNATFLSAKMSSYKVTALALTSLLQEKYGEKEIEVGLANSQDDVNDVIYKTLTQFRDISQGIKEEQIISIIVRDTEGDFKGACKISSLLDDNNKEDSSLTKASYFDLSQLESYTSKDEESLRDRIHILFQIHNEIFEAGRGKIIQEVDNSNIDKNTGSLILFEEYNNEIELYHLKINKINEEYNNSDYKIDLKQMNSLSCFDFPSFEEFNNTLQQVQDKTYEIYKNSFPDNDGSDNFYSQIDILKHTNEIKRRSCEIYFSIDQSSMKKAAASAD